ncbi:MAG: signal peptidase II [Ruminococcus sp.]|nr:signal peptidase II [Ruminococcus sp.]
MAIVYLLLALVIAGVDQLIKYFVLENLVDAGRVSAIPHILDLIYVENRGVAFGMFSDLRWLFVIITSIVIITFIILLFKDGCKSKLFSIACVLIVGGGIGNLIDRIAYGFVVDYLQLSFFSPVCNFADYCITVGTVLLVIYLLFYSDFAKEDKKNIEITDNGQI